jgi:hypothetical protein
LDVIPVDLVLEGGDLRVLDVRVRWAQPHTVPEVGAARLDRQLTDVKEVLERDRRALTSVS